MPGRYDITATKPRYILAVDPGVSTGTVLLGLAPGWVSSDGSWEALKFYTVAYQWQTFGKLGEPSLGEGDQIRELRALIRMWPDAMVVMEDFQLRTKSRDREARTPERILAALNTSARLTAKEYPGFSLQQPADAKRVATDERLVRAGLWVPGADNVHNRDAARHAALAARKWRRWVQALDARIAKSKAAVGESV